MGQYRQYYNKGTIVFCTLIRFFLAGLILLQAKTENIPIVETGWFCYLILALWGISMGVVNVGTFILSAELVSEERKELSGFVTVIGVNVGSTIGGLLSLLLTGSAGGH